MPSDENIFIFTSQLKFRKSRLPIGGLMKVFASLLALAFLLLTLPVRAQEPQSDLEQNQTGARSKKLALVVEAQGISVLADVDGDGLPEPSTLSKFIPNTKLDKEIFG